MLDISDAPGFRRLLAAVGLAGAPLLGLAAALLITQDQVDGDSFAAELGAIAADSGAFQAANVLFMASGLLTVLAALGLLHLLRRRAAVLGHVGGALLAFGGIALFAISLLEFVRLEMVAAGADLEQMVALGERIEGTVGFAIVLVGLIGGLTLGTLVLGIALLYGKVAPRWVGAAVIASQVLIAAGNGPNGSVLAVVAFALLTLGLGYVAVKVLGMSRRAVGARRRAR